MKLEILYEDAYLIACVKPYGVLSQGDKGNDEDMITKVKHYLYDQDTSEQAEEPYVAAIHRLDRPVGGVMVFAKTRIWRRNFRTCSRMARLRNIIRQ